MAQFLTTVNKTKPKRTDINVYLQFTFVDTFLVICLCTAAAFSPSVFVHGSLCLQFYLQHLTHLAVEEHPVSLQYSLSYYPFGL